MLCIVTFLHTTNFSSLLKGGGTVKDFCSTEVEPMFRESDHIHIIGGIYL